MTEQELIAALWRFATGSLAVIGVLVVGIFMWMRGRIEAAATKEELTRVESDMRQSLRDHALARIARDEQVDTVLSRIDDTVTRTHERIDFLFTKASSR